MYYLLKMLLYFRNIITKYKLIKMGEYIVKPIMNIFCTEKSLKNLEKISTKVCKIEV